MKTNFNVKSHKEKKRIIDNRKESCTMYQKNCGDETELVRSCILFYLLLSYLWFTHTHKTIPRPFHCRHRIPCTAGGDWNDDSCRMKQRCTIFFPCVYKKSCKELSIFYESIFLSFNSFFFSSLLSTCNSYKIHLIMPSNFFTNYFNKRHQEQQQQQQQHYLQEQRRTSIPSPEVENVTPVSNPAISNLIQDERPKNLYHRSSDNLAIGL